MDIAAAHFTPSTDIVEDAETYQFYFEMPGLKRESVDVRVEEGRLIVEAERVRPEWPKDATVHLSERTYGAMRRSFKFPEDALTDGISASYRDGVLNVRRSEEAGDQAAAHQSEQRLIGFHHENL